MSKSPSLRRIKADIRELSIDPSDQYHAAPLEHDMFEWHFTIRGAEETDFAGGVYHGKILLPPEYPFKPPNIVFLTPSGRFETGVKVCLSFSAHHPELWQPAWGIRLILEALISFLPTPADGAIGALDWTSEERKKLAKESVKFRCPMCCAEGKTCAGLIPELKAKGGDDKPKKKSKFQEEIDKLKMMQFQNHASDITEDTKEEGKKEDGAADQKQPAQPSGAKQPADNDTSLQQKQKGTDSDSKPSATSASPREASQQRSPDDNPTVDTAVAPRPPSPLPPLLPANNAQVATPAVNAAPAAANNNNNNAPMVSDSMLHGIIAAFAIVVIVLLRQAQSLVDELRSLEEDE